MRKAIAAVAVSAAAIAAAIGLISTQSAEHVYVNWESIALSCSRNEARFGHEVNITMYGESPIVCVCWDRPLTPNGTSLVLIENGPVFVGVLWLSRTPRFTGPVS